MEHVAPLFQTILWVALVAGVVWRFHIPIHGLLTALHKRIEQGSTVKAGPFELSDDLRPQNVAEQRESVESEAEELLGHQIIEADENAEIVPRPTSQKDVKASLLEAEDLALRALQSEYRQPIGRQLTLRGDFTVDGVFSFRGKLFAIEVKHLISEKNAEPLIRRTLDAFASHFEEFHWHQVHVILAIVVHSSAFSISEVRSQIEHLKLDYDFGVDIRYFSLNELRDKFSIS